jgi:hypothetical protein
MVAVATDAGRHRLISLAQELPVDAREIFRLLIYPEGGIVPFHKTGVAVALAAEGRNLRGFGPAHKTARRGHGQFLVGLGGVTAMAAGAPEPFLQMDIALHLPREILIQVGMAGNAGIGWFCLSREEGDRGEETGAGDQDQDLPGTLSYFRFVFSHG